MEHDVRPLLAVIPDNRDPTLNVGPPRNDFWQWVRTAQNRGWAIGLHGYQHLYSTEHAGIVGLNRRSEFAGLKAAEQRQKLQRATQIFRNERVHPDVWIAPSHSFDDTTVRLLKEEGIKVISDGLFFNPTVDSHGVVWVPQQLCRFRPRPFGVWTICFHHNQWNDSDIARFQNGISSYERRLVSLRTILKAHSHRPHCWYDTMAAGIALQWFRVGVIISILWHRVRKIT